MDSDNIEGLPQSSFWFTSLSSTSTSASMSSAMNFAQTGQLSPISNGMDASYHGADQSCCSSSSASGSASPDSAHSMASLASIGYGGMGHDSHHGSAGHRMQLSQPIDSSTKVLVAAPTVWT